MVPVARHPGDGDLPPFVFIEGLQSGGQAGSLGRSEEGSALRLRLGRGAAFHVPAHSSVSGRLLDVFRFGWKWRRRSPSKLMERAHEEARKHYTPDYGNSHAHWVMAARVYSCVTPVTPRAVELPPSRRGRQPSPLDWSAHVDGAGSQQWKTGNHPRNERQCGGCGGSLRCA